MRETTAKDPFFVKISLEGPVRYPGQYQVPENIALDTLIDYGGGLKRYYKSHSMEQALKVTDGEVVNISKYIVFEPKKFNYQRYGKKYRESRY